MINDDYIATFNNQIKLLKE